MQKVSILLVRALLLLSENSPHLAPGLHLCAGSYHNPALPVYCQDSLVPVPPQAKRFIPWLLSALPLVWSQSYSLELYLGLEPWVQGVLVDISFCSFLAQGIVAPIGGGATVASLCHGVCVHARMCVVHRAPPHAYQRCPLLCCSFSVTGRGPSTQHWLMIGPASSQSSALGILVGPLWPPVLGMRGFSDWLLAHHQ